MSLSVYTDNKNKDILILGEGTTQVLNNTTLTAEAKYPIDFTQSGKRLALTLHYSWSNSFLFVIDTKQSKRQNKATLKEKIIHCI